MLELSEYQESCLLAEYLDVLQMQGKVKLYTHIPNETFTKSWGVKMKNKKLGVARGVPDYMIVLSQGLVFIEMKRKGRSVLSQEQKEWQLALLASGASAFVCKGFDEAKSVLDSL